MTVNIGKYRQRVTFRKLTTGANNKSGTWSDLKTVWSDVEERNQIRTQSGNQIIEGHFIVAKVRKEPDLDIYSNSTSYLNSKNRITYDSQDYDIHSVRKLNEFELEVIGRKT